MLRWTLLLCIGLYLTLSIGGEDRGQQRLGLLEAERDAERATARAAAGSDAQVTAGQDRTEPSVDLAFAPRTALITPPAHVQAAVAEAVSQALSDTQAALTPIAGSQPETAPGRVMYVTGRAVNVRNGPSTRTEVVDRLLRGDEVSVVWVEQNGWARIRVEGDGVDGYMALGLLSETPPAN